MNNARHLWYNLLLLGTGRSILNKLMAELALTVAPFGFELSTIHAWSMHNETCDWLSRAESEDTVPKPLTAAVRSSDRRPKWSVLTAAS